MARHPNSHDVSRRDFLKRTAASAATVSLAAPAIAQNAGGRVVVVGGGFAGASCARALKRLDPRTSVTLIEASQTFTACPFSNNVIAGLRDLKAQQFDYKKFAADKITVTFAAAMRAFRTGERAATVMDRIAKGFSEAETAAIAAWYAEQK